MFTRQFWEFGEDVATIEKKARQGDIEAIRKMYAETSENSDNETAFNWLTRAADIICSSKIVNDKEFIFNKFQHSWLIQRYINALLYGKGCEVNVNKACEVILKAAKCGALSEDCTFTESVTDIDIWNKMYFDQYIDKRIAELEEQLKEADEKQRTSTKSVFEEDEYWWDVDKEYLLRECENLKKQKVLNASNRISDFLKLRIDICYEQKEYKSILDFAFKYKEVYADTYQKLVDKYGFSQEEMNAFYVGRVVDSVFGDICEPISFIGLSDLDIAQLALHSGTYNIATRHFQNYLLLSKIDEYYIAGKPSIIFTNKCIVNISYGNCSSDEFIPYLQSMVLVSNLLWLAQSIMVQNSNQSSRLDNTICCMNTKNIHDFALNFINEEILPICYYNAYNYDPDAQNSYSSIFFFSDCLFKLFEQHLSNKEFELFVNVFKFFENKYDKEIADDFAATQKANYEAHMGEYREAHPEEFIDDEGFHPGESPEEFWSHED